MKGSENFSLQGMIKENESMQYGVCAQPSLGLHPAMYNFSQNDVTTAIGRAQYRISNIGHIGD